jgi:RNA polymerase sigma-70 factor (ECF subfamily)
LVERARDGDDVAFSELVDLDGDLCYAIAYRLRRDAEQAQDAVQQAFLLAWRELPGCATRNASAHGSTGCS